MGVEGIGARVTRKEDKRFLTGKGRYTDDMSVPGMKYACFVRSPYAHARIRGIDVSPAKAMPGVIDVLEGKALQADGIGNLICGWMIHSRDGSPMNIGAWRPLAHETVRYVGDAVAIVVADSSAEARDAAEAVVVDYEELPAVTEAVAALEAGAPQIHPEALAAWSQGGGTVEVDSAALDWGPLKLAMNGTLALDRDLQPTAAMTAEVRGAAQTLSALQDQLKPNELNIARTVVAMLARPDGDGEPVIKAPLTIQHRGLFVGPLKLAPVPVIQW